MSWRCKVGLIYPSDGVLDYEFWNLVPQGVSVHITRLPIASTELTLAAAKELANLERIKQAAETLHATRPDVITYACTVGSFIEGPAHMGNIIRVLSDTAGCIATTTSNALIESLKALSVGRVGILSPYVYDISRLLRDFVEAHGIIVKEMEILDLTSSIEKVSAEMVYHKANGIGKKLVDAVFISCTGLPTLEILAPLEEDLGKPVLAANQITIWHALKIAGVRASFGRFLST